MNQRVFDVYNGVEIIATQLQNKNGCTAEIINFGGVIHSLKVPDKNGNFLDVILGHNTVEEYRTDGASHGALIGRYGNRIGKGKINVNGVDYQLALNDNGINHLHGGNIGYSRRVWNIDSVSENSVTLSLVDEDGTENYPGTIRLAVTYTLTDDNSFDIEYRAITDKDTYFNPTNHAYFNLSGYNSGPITDHLMKINADFYTPTGADLIPTGEVRSVENTPFDFRTAKAIGQDVEADDEDLKNGGGYDHNLILGDPKTYKENACEIYDAKSGIVMTVSTDMPAVQLYIGNFLDGSFNGKDGKPIPRRTGFCLETQYSPDTPNKENFPSCLLKKDEEFYSKTSYRFAIK